jgi:hypothetical protein
MSIVIHHDLLQGSDEWLEARRGILTASEMKLILTPTLKVASNEKERAHVYELAAQRITAYVEPHYVGSDMLRGHEDEAYAREVYSEHFAPVDEVGFITNDKWGVTIGYSPDGVVGADGLIEIKSRRQKFQVETILNQEVPAEFTLQIQTGLLVSERKWCDFVSYSGGLPMVTIRIYPNEEIQDAIVNAATAFESRVVKLLRDYGDITASDARLIPTERRIEQEIAA